VASAACDPAARSGILYAGNLYPHYRPEVLLDALKLLPGETLHVVGGNDEAQVAAFRRQAAERGVADRLVLHGFVPPGQMAGFLDRFRVGVTLLTGLKAADYLSRALPFVSPDLPVMRDILRDGDTCLLFEPGSAASLAAALRRILGDPALACRLAAGALAEARLHAQPLRARRLIAFLESLL
jgi:glycosyltransferase involved in cell wall biosynthesis